MSTAASKPAPSQTSPSSDATAEARASVAARSGNPEAEVRGWLLEATSATLCTLSVKEGVEGYPFGSIVPFALLADGAPVLLIADIAAHTHNLKQDNRCSLFVHQPGVEGDPQSGWRATIMGRFSRIRVADEDDRGCPSVVVPAEELAFIDARYRERVPQAGGYFDTHGFAYWQLTELHRVRSIAGFGRITWLGPDAVYRDPLGGGLAEAAAGAIAHMNEDHGENMREMCRGLAGFDPKSVELVAIDRAGFTVRCHEPDRLAHFSFGHEIDADGLRAAAVELVKRARAAAAS